MNGTLKTDELSFPDRAEGHLATNQESGNRFGNVANISDSAEISVAGWEPLGRRRFLIKRDARRRNAVVFVPTVSSELGTGVPEVEDRVSIVSTIDSYTTW